MGYTIDINGGYILGVGRCKGSGNSNAAEYSSVIAALNNCPRRENYGYRLKTDLTWEEYELPPTPVPSDVDEITDEEAYNIIMGVDA